MKITDQRTKPFGVKEAVEYLRDEASQWKTEAEVATTPDGAATARKAVAVTESLADEIEHRAAGAGKPADVVEIPPGTWFTQPDSDSLFFRSEYPGNSIFEVHHRGMFYHSHLESPQWASVAGIPVHVELVVTDAR